MTSSSACLGSIGWRREDVFITNVVKCRPPENRDPEPDEVAACAPFLRRQLEILDPSLIVTLGRHSMARFMPGHDDQSRPRHRSRRPIRRRAPGDAMVMALYHPAAALRTRPSSRRAMPTSASCRPCSTTPGPGGPASATIVPDDAPAAARGWSPLPRPRRAPRPTTPRRSRRRWTS